MFFRKERKIKQLLQQSKYLLERVERNDLYEEKQRQNIQRIRDSKIVFENTDGVRNLYVDDRLDFGTEIVIYDSRIAVENSLTNHFSKYEADTMGNLSVVGYLELDYCCDNYMKISKLAVNKPYRRCGYATRMLMRVIEFAELRGVKKIELFASADGDISQKDLILMYEKIGFRKKAINSNTMIYDVP